jgi:hypothetical protein
MPAWEGRGTSAGERILAFDPMPASGSGGPYEPLCMSCHAPISENETSVRIDFEQDPHGHRGLSGEYHEACSKPFASIAYALKALSSFGRL